jgi:hypothetical protein
MSLELPQGAVNVVEVIVDLRAFVYGVVEHQRDECVVMDCTEIRSHRHRGCS